MRPSLIDLGASAGFTLFDYQEMYLEAVRELPGPQRTCLYYKTGAGKSFTSLASIKLWGYDECLVIAPPSTHMQWRILGDKLGVTVQPMSHAKFRQKLTKLSKTVPVIADEFHLFGGQKGQGWRKLAVLAQHLQAPLILMSATPNYNDAERVYCVQRILSPHDTKGGYLQFLYEHCNTEQNRFSIEPTVTGFKNYKDAAAFLADLPMVYYLPDERTVTIQDLAYDQGLPSEMYTHRYNRRKHRMIASDMEMRHTERVQGLVDDHGLIRTSVLDTVLDITAKPGGVLIYASHAQVADALSDSMNLKGINHVVMTGVHTQKQKELNLRQVLHGRVHTLIGTSTLATGTDGLDRLFNTLLILDDTDDDALRRQLIGRILPRGDFLSVVDKEVFRLVPIAAQP